MNTDPNHHARWHHWDGRTTDAALSQYLSQAPGAIWWVAVDLFTPESGGAWLMITYEQSLNWPLKVPPDSWLHFDQAAGAFQWFERGPDHDTAG